MAIGFDLYIKENVQRLFIKFEGEKMTMTTKKRIEVCDFCYEESQIGCTGVGPKTEVGIIDVMAICSRCRLRSLHSSIEKVKKEISEYQKMFVLDEYEMESFYEFREYLREAIVDLRYLLGKTIQHYMKLYPGLFHPLNEGISGIARSGIYTQLDEENHITVWMVEHHGVQFRDVASAFTRDLGLSSFTVVRPIASIGSRSPLISGASELISIVEGKGESAY
ncbi:hypothetical protein EHV15_35745 [Paenibacillus oralis]|uniref:Uncharacterized protein n=1 Tax=Paenibacillus oralis TaxID=2490856 RepID=A0A3P3TA93_9BACL|nr:hypothetical protein [Paenibacillus oralis]RRJ54927.1 hypothetical protein EHV15_35745 [Paenibacillus oralis]